MRWWHYVLWKLFIKMWNLLSYKIQQRGQGCVHCKALHFEEIVKQFFGYFDAQMVIFYHATNKLNIKWHFSFILAINQGGNWDDSFLLRHHLNRNTCKHRHSFGGSCRASFWRPSLLPGGRTVSECSRSGQTHPDTHTHTTKGQQEWRWRLLMTVCCPVITTLSTYFVPLKKTTWEARWRSRTRRVQRKCQRRGEVCGLTCQWVDEVSTNLASCCEL